MTELVDSSGNQLNTKEDGKESGDENGTQGVEATEQAKPASTFNVEEKFFVVRIPILNNLYEVLAHVLWAQDKIRDVYLQAQMRKHQQSKLAKPTGFLKGFTKWRG